jgi:Alpha/beta hydrolase of unknown function (DUF900)
MGAWLTVEALRQLRLSGKDRVIERLHHVALAAPDIFGLDRGDWFVLLGGFASLASLVLF